jgi:uncharacterized phosphosugar-binding protein
MDDIYELLARVVTESKSEIADTATSIVATGKAGGLVRPAGAGHSLAAVLETFFRAGGLAFVRPIWDERVFPLYGALRATDAEREPGLGRATAEAADIRPEDTVLVISTSGVNPFPVEVAQVGIEHEATVVAMTSRTASAKAPPRADVRLAEVATIVIDTHVPAGDVTWPPDAPVTAPASSLITTALWTAILREVHTLWPEAPRWRSANVVGTDDSNETILASLAERIPELRAVK